MTKPVAITLTIVVIVLILVGLGAWWYLAAQPAAAPAPISQTQTTQTQDEATPETTEEGITIVFTDDGFEEDSYTVKAGQTVTVKNNSSVEVEFSSDEHPTHTDNPELNMEDLQPGQEQTFTPNNPGTWGIHDHKHAQFTTSLTVTE